MASGNVFAVGIWLETVPNKTIVWTAHRDDITVSESSTLLLTHDGWLLLKTPGGPDKNITGANQSASLASFLDSGNFVLYDSNSTIIWESFSSPTDTILGGQSLLSDKQLYSTYTATDHRTGRFQLVMQADGNLVLYPIYSFPTGADAYWSSDSVGSSKTLILDNLGKLYLASSVGINITLANGTSSSNERAVVYRATLDTDGNFRLYSHFFWGNGSPNMSISWVALSNQCAVNGFCGFNSYCTLMDTEPKCLCLPGFDYSDPIHKFQGCVKNFTLASCNNKKDELAYSIHTIEKLAWRDIAYFIVTSNGEEDCSNECQRDCECEAAMLKGDRCMKLRLPLIYGKREDSTTTFLKVSNETSTNNGIGSRGNFDNKKALPTEILIIIIVLAVFCIAVFLVSAFLIYKLQVQGYTILAEARNNISLTEEIALRFFSYNQLLKATDGFKEELGRGSFGRVYKGSLSNGGRIIAVKRLEKLIEDGEREFRAETSAIGRTYHRNLVRLLGFCDEGSNRLLVYEYMANGSLANLIFKHTMRPDWNERVRIAIDVARGILYLHEECEPHIIHCDIKPENILMDDFWTAKISDFGLAKLLMPNQTRTFTQIRGTRGYLAPEWHKNSPITVKVDVYSYGIVLLEIICCRRTWNLNLPDDEIFLTDWVYNCFVGGELGKLLGGEDVDKARLERMVKVGLWCIQNEPHLRPSMKSVILMLEGIRDIPIPPSPSASTMAEL
ncbi:G-type lectin S-receptor-like serine/threonine-protein kinase LECRK1 isoform X2 [Tasmannia lanceolata]|uniref:G-type lectin S-receptor-like serine/threonine-protein kinase LECRK1 isoform X2 n=1 Tax=Tasmannia lanceolata TaxID=3420 RepID=UPI004063CB1A